MNRLITAILIACAVRVASGQSGEPQPRFEAADVHVSARTANPFMRTAPSRGGRYEVKTATMVDLIRIAYGFDAEKIVGGPNWLEMDRFDVIAKLPAGATPETQDLMLQSLLKDRFKLAAHPETRALPTYALAVGKKLGLKEAGGSEESGCKPQSPSGAPGDGMVRMFVSTTGGAPATFTLGPGMTIQYACRNITMSAFAAGLRGMMGASLGQNAVLDETGLKGAWNFDLKYSMQMMGMMMGDTGDRITLASALDKLGLKLEERQMPTPVLVVESVNRTPGENPPGTSDALPAIPVATEFEVATIKPSDPGGAVRMSRFQMQPGGRLVVEGMPLRFLINRAFNTNNNERVAGLPAFVDSDRYDIVAKVPAGAAAPGPVDMDAMAPLLLSLLTDRFQLKYHTEERTLTAYSLAAARPKMKKADPESRTYCRTANAPAGAPPGSRALTCQNITMAQFAERLQNLTPELNWPVSDGTEIEGGWDFTLTFSMRPMMMSMMGSMTRPGEAAGGLPSASDPTGGYTIFEALEKQLGLKLEKQKRTMPLIVVDHIEQTPTEN